MVDFSCKFCLLTFVVIIALLATFYLGLQVTTKDIQIPVKKCLREFGRPPICKTLTNNKIYHPTPFGYLKLCNCGPNDESCLEHHSSTRFSNPVSVASKLRNLEEHIYMYYLSTAFALCLLLTIVHNLLFCFCHNHMQSLVSLAILISSNKLNIWMTFLTTCKILTSISFERCLSFKFIREEDFLYWMKMIPAMLISDILAAAFSVVLQQFRNFVSDSKALLIGNLLCLLIIIIELILQLFIFSKLVGKGNIDLDIICLITTLILIGEGIYIVYANPKKIQEKNAYLALLP